MALINCPECGKEISDQSQVCIHCGFPLSDPAHIAEIGTPTPKNKKNPLKIIAFVLWVTLFLTFAVFTVLYFIDLLSEKPGNNTSEEIKEEEFSLSENEELAYDVIKDYKRYLKDPDSLKLRGTIYIIESGFDKYVCFIASASNSYGGIVTSNVYYKNYEYLGNYEDDVNAEDLKNMTESERDKFLNWLNARVLLATRLYDLPYYAKPVNGKSEDKDGNIYFDIDGEKIANVLKCAYSKE